MDILKNVLIIIISFIVFQGCTVPSNNLVDNTKNIRNTVVPLIITDSNPLETRRLIASGSGVIIGPKYIITAAHVVSQKGNLLIFRYTSPDRPPVQLTVVKINEELDLALLTGDVDCPCASFSATPPELDQTIYSVGFPLFHSYGLQILTTGSFQGTTNNYFATTNTTAPGASGGGIFTKTHGVIDSIGINKFDGVIQLQTWITFSVTNNSISEFLKDTPAQKYLKPYNIRTVLKPKT